MRNIGFASVLCLDVDLLKEGSDIILDSSFYSSTFIEKIQ